MRLAFFKWKSCESGTEELLDGSIIIQSVLNLCPPTKQYYISITMSRAPVVVNVPKL